MVAIGTKLYYCGGDSSSTRHANMYEWTQPTDTWTEKTPMPAALQGHLAKVIGTKLYVAGGSDLAGSTQKTLYEWDQGTDVWTSKALMPTARRGAAGAVVGTKLYVMHGYGPKDTDVWDQAANEWTTIAGPNFYIDSRAEAVGGTINGDLFLIGGFAASVAMSTASKLVVGDTWYEEDPLDKRIASGGGDAIGSAIYIVPGEFHTDLPDRAVREWTPRQVVPPPPPTEAEVAGWNIFVVARS